jgi:hypothetical protein
MRLANSRSWLGIMYRSRIRSYFTTDGQPVSISWYRAHSGTCDQILLPVGKLLSENVGIVSAGCPLWRENGSAVCSAIAQWSESLRTRNHTLLSHLRIPQNVGPCSRIYTPRNRVAQGTSFPLRSLLRLAELWRMFYSIRVFHRWRQLQRAHYITLLLKICQQHNKYD